jgi:L-alanine-DL-glutamate epimerase-like enolase superfamily enzyme
MIVVDVKGGGAAGIGYTYSDQSAASLIARVLSERVTGTDAMDVEACYVSMVHAVRNLGQQGLAATAIAVYGSGGFTSYSIDRLQDQLGGWAAAGIGAVKMKIGRDPTADRERVHAAREAIGPDVELFVDANGAYDRKLALNQAERFAADDVRWFEEPVSSDDLDGLRLLRDRAPARMEIAAGEYGYDIQYFRRMLQAGAVDVLQADATRCCGVSGFLRAAALCDSWGLPLSAHTAPSVHAHLCCAASRARHLEYFHDHARIERMLFDGALQLVDGTLRPDRARPGLGIQFKRADAARFAV